MSIYAPSQKLVDLGLGWCMKIQINDQGRVCKWTQHFSTYYDWDLSTYYFIISITTKRFIWTSSRTIKDSLIKEFDENPGDWPYVAAGVLFIQRTSKHMSFTIHSQFFLLYNLESTLPMDIKFDLVETEENQIRNFALW